MSNKLPLTIRPAEISDAVSLSALAWRTFDEAFSEYIPAMAMQEYLSESFNPEQVNIDLKDPDSLFLLAESEGEAVGYAKLYWGPAPAEVTGLNPIKLWRLYAVSDFHGRGVGAALMVESIKIAKERGYKTLWLTVNIGNIRAIALYERFGFVVTGKSGFLLGGVPQEDHIMELNLE